MDVRKRASAPPWATVTGSNHGHSTIDVNRLPGDISRFIGAEIDRRGGDILGRSEPCCRNLREDVFALLVVERVRHRRLDESGRDAVRSDVALGVFRAQRLDHADQSRLRGGVIALAGIAGDTDDRGDGDDAAEPLAHHQLGRGPGQAEGRGQIDLDDFVPVLVAQLHEQIVPGDAGVTDQNVDLAHGLFRRRHQCLDLGSVGKVAGQHLNPPAQFAGERVQHLAPSPGNRHRRALRVQRLRDRAADAAGSTSDERRPASQIEHHRLPQAVCAAASASFAAAISFGPPTEIPTAPSAMRLTSPLSTLPAPISKNLTTPWLAIYATDSRQRTVPVTCSIRRRRISSGSVIGAASTLDTKGETGRLMVTPASAFAITSAAGCINRQWNGADTGSSMARLAPLVLAISSARSTAALSPETTTCPPPLSLAAWQTWPCAASSATATAVS